MNQTHEDFRSILYSQVLLSGGNFNIPNIVTRFMNEAQACGPDDVEIQVDVQPK